MIPQGRVSAMDSSRRTSPARSEETEGNFDGDNNGNGLTVGSKSRLEPPQFHCFDGLFFQTETRALHYLNVNGATVRGDYSLEDNRTLVFRFTCFFRIFRIRAIST